MHCYLFHNIILLLVNYQKNIGSPKSALMSTPHQMLATPPAFMKQGIKYRGELIARFLPRDRISKRSIPAEEDQQQQMATTSFSSDDDRYEYIPPSYCWQKNSSNTTTNINNKLFLPSRTPWNGLPFSSQITSTSIALDDTDNEQQCFKSNVLDDENDLILTMDISFQDVDANNHNNEEEVEQQQPQPQRNVFTHLHLTRNQTESVVDTLERMQRSIDKKLLKQYHCTTQEYKLRKHLIKKKSQEKTHGINGSNIIFTKTSFLKNGDEILQTLDTTNVESIGDLFRQLAFLSLNNTWSSDNNKNQPHAIVESQSQESSKSGSSSSSLEEETSCNDAGACASNTENKDVVLTMWLPQQSLRLDILPLPPTILDVHSFEKFQQDVLVGVPLVVECDLLYADAEVVPATWYVNDAIVLSSCRSSSRTSANNKHYYIPSERDIGKIIKVTLVPRRRNHINHQQICYGQPVTKVFHKPVTPVPYMPIVHRLRHGWLNRYSNNDDNTMKSERDEESHRACIIRVVSYNLLADVYESQELFDDKRPRHEHLSCPEDLLKRSHRFPMILSELLEYKADILCLQEVDEMIFDTLLRPTLGVMGYRGYFGKKISLQKEGCAIFWSTLKFQHVEGEMQTLSISQLFDADNDNTLVHWDGIAKLNALMDQHDELRSITKEKIGQILQVVMLKARPSSTCVDHDLSFVVANTHLFYHPLAAHIRAMQTLAVCRKIDLIRKRQKGCDTPKTLPFILCGDLNATPSSGSLHLLLHRKLLPYQCNTWRYLNYYTWEMPYTSSMGEDEDLADQEQLKYQYKLPALELPPSFPPLILGCENSSDTFTHYVRGFIGTLDYILASSHHGLSEDCGFERVSFAPMPHRKDIIPYAAMPNEGMPSDHVSLVCDLKWCYSSLLPHDEEEQQN
jgi:mRNA deadenylase 3'-5' endonuclease subunit Ccr4